MMSWAKAPAPQKRCVVPNCACSTRVRCTSAPTTGPPSSYTPAPDNELYLRHLTSVRDFQILFDEGEASQIDDAAYLPYGTLGFPAPPADRPWVYANFVQSIDGVA